VLWERRTVIVDEAGAEFHLHEHSRSRGGQENSTDEGLPMIELLVAIHYRENNDAPRPDWTEFWLRQARTPELLARVNSAIPR